MSDGSAVPATAGYSGERALQAASFYVVVFLLYLYGLQLSQRSLCWWCVVHCICLSRTASAIPGRASVSMH